MKISRVSPVLGVSLLALTASTVQAQVIVDNFASANGFSTGIVSPLTRNNYLAQAFTTGNQSYSSVDVTVRLNLATSDTMQAALYDTLAQFPGNNLTGFVSSTPSGSGAQTITFENLAANLAGATQYFVVLRPTSDANGGFFWFHASNLNNAGNGLIGTGTNTQFFSGNAGLIWNNQSFAPNFVGSESYIMRIVGSSAAVAAPEPGTLALVLCGVGALATRRRRAS